MVALLRWDISQELRPFFWGGPETKGARRGGLVAGRLTPAVLLFPFSKEGLRNLGKLSRGLSKLIWELHTNFIEIEMQEIHIQRDSNPNIPSKKNPLESIVLWYALYKPIYFKI